MAICALVKQSQTPVKAFGAGAPRRIAGSYDMKNPQAIFDEIAALQQQGLDPEQIAARLEALAMEDAQTRTIEMVRGPRGTVRLRFLLEGAEIYFDGY